MLATRAAAEVLAGQQDAGTGELRFVQYELRVGLFPCIVQEAPVVEQVLAKADAVHLLQELLGNDGVGVDVGAVEGNDDPFMLFETCHVRSLLQCTNVGEAAGDGGGGGHGRAHQVGATGTTLTPSKLRLLVEAQRSPVAAGRCSWPDTWSSRANATQSLPR